MAQTGPECLRWAGLTAIWDSAVEAEGTFSTFSWDLGRLPMGQGCRGEFLWVDKGQVAAGQRPGGVQAFCLVGGPRPAPGSPLSFSPKSVRKTVKLMGPFPSCSMASNSSSGTLTFPGGGVVRGAWGPSVSPAGLRLPSAPSQAQGWSVGAALGGRRVRQQGRETRGWKKQGSPLCRPPAAQRPGQALAEQGRAGGSVHSPSWE